MKKFFNYLSIIILFLVIVATAVFFKDNTYTNDDFWAAFFKNGNLLDVIIYSDQGLVLSSFVMKIFAHSVPDIFHFHPQQNIFMSVIKGLDVSLFIYVFSRFFNVGKKNIPNPVVVIFNVAIVISLIILMDIFELFLVNVHFKYLFNLLVGFSLWLIWYREFLNDEFLLAKNRLRDCIFVLILTLCGHLVVIPTIFMFLSLCIYEIKKTNSYYENFKHFLRKNYAVCLSYIIFFIGYISLPGFYVVRSYRMPKESVFYYSLTHFWDFSAKFFEHIFSNPYISALLFATIIGFIIMFICRQRIDKKYIIISGSIFIANLLFQYSLLTCGTTYYDGKSYWFISVQLTSTFAFYLIVCCNIVYGCLYRLINKNKLKILFIAICFIFINVVFPVNSILKNVKFIYNVEKFQQEFLYKLNKICRYYDLKGETIYVPKDYVKYINTLSGVDIAPALIYNFQIIYHISADKTFEQTDKKIINENELFSEKELKNINFKKLYDDKFILQMKEPIYSEK